MIKKEKYLFFTFLLAILFSHLSCGDQIIETVANKNEEQESIRITADEKPAIVSAPPVVNEPVVAIEPVVTPIPGPMLYPSPYLGGGGRPKRAICGNGRVEGIEQCDDGNQINGDGCSALCLIETSISDLSISKSHSPLQILPGSTVNYTIIVDNFGPDPASNVQVVDTLPSGVTFVSSTIVCSNESGVLTCNLGELGPNSSVFFSIAVTVNSGTGGTTQINNAVVNSDSEDPDPSNNEVNESITVTATADLSVVKLGTPQPALAGQNITYTITVTNSGPDTASNILITDVIPAGLTYVSSSTGCNFGGGTVLCSIQSLPNGQQQQVTITVTANPGTEGTSIQNTALVTSGSIDPTLPNFSSFVSNISPTKLESDPKTDLNDPPIVLGKD